MSEMSEMSETGGRTCAKPLEEDIDYYLQKGAPHCDDPVTGAESAGYAPVLADNEEETALKCYKLDEDEDIIGDKVYIDGDGRPPPMTHMMKMQNAINNLNPQNQNPGIQPGDIERVGSYFLAIGVVLILICTILYYALFVYSQPHGSFWLFVKNWSIKMPRWWWCPPANQNPTK